MPRFGSSRRSFTAKSKAEYAMVRPKMSASISSSSLQKVGSLNAIIGVTETWQRDAYGYFETIGELAQVIHQTANILKGCEIRPIEISSELNPNAYQETKDERVSRVWRAFDGSGGKAELYRKATLHLQIAGESYLLGTPLVDASRQDAGFLWEFCSSEEIHVENNGRTVKRLYGGYAGMQPVELPEDVYIARLFRSDPRFAQQADCAMKHVLPICKEVILLTQVVDAITTCRLPAGILYVPDEMSFGPYDETEDDSDETDEIDPFTQEIIEQLTSPVENRASAASLIPLILRGPAEFFDRIGVVDLGRDLNEIYKEMRMEAIERIAVGLDVPREIMFGKGGLNHWSSYNVDSDFITDHIVPVGNTIAEFLTSAYLRPMLIEKEEMSEDEASSYRLHFDPAKVISKTDASANARAAYDRRDLSTLSFLRENGFDESDMPTEDERKERDMRELMYAEPLIWGPPVMEWLYPDLKGLLVVPGLPDANAYKPGVEPGDRPGNPSSVPERKNPTGPDSSPVIDQDTGQGEPVARGPAGPRADSTIIDRLAVAADAALERALERAGNKVISKMSTSHSELRARCKSMSASEVSSSLSEKEWKMLRCTSDDLLEGAWDGFKSRATGWLVDYFSKEGFGELTAEAKAAAVLEALEPMMSIMATSFLRKPAQANGNGLYFPNRLIEDAFAYHERVTPFERP